MSARLVSELDEIYGVKTINWENSSWKYLSLIGDGRVFNLQRTKVYVFSDSVLCLGKIHQHPESNEAWNVFSDSVMCLGKIFENTQSNDAWEQRLGCLKIFSGLQKV